MQLVNRSKTNRIMLAGLLSLGSLGWAQTFSPCDLNKDGVVNSADVTIAINMAIGAASCGANIQGSTTCGVVTVQRVINATQGQACITYNSHAATLNWVASTSPSIQGYNIYRGTVSGGPYTKLAMVTSGTTYVDTTVQAGQIYYYVATTVDISGNESAYSSQTTATIPNP